MKGTIILSLILIVGLCILSNLLVCIRFQRWYTANVSLPQKYPFKRGTIHGLDYLRQFPHLRPQTGVYSRLLRLRSAATMAVHHFFQNRGFINVHTPIITSSDCEGAGELFEITVSFKNFHSPLKIFTKDKIFTSLLGQQRRKRCFFLLTPFLRCQANCMLRPS